MYAGITDWGYGGVWGHEVAGVVEAIGPGTKTELKVGDHVARAGTGSCGACHYCSVGLTRLCVVAGGGRSKAIDPETGKEIIGSFGLSEYAVSDVESLVKMSPDLAFEEALLLSLWPVSSEYQQTGHQTWADCRSYRRRYHGVAQHDAGSAERGLCGGSDLDPARRKKALNLQPTLAGS